MADKTGIEWTDATWNPIVGCSIVSPGCTNCYAMKMAARLQKINRTGGSGTNYVNHYDGTTKLTKAGPVWTGHVAQAADHILTAPLRWKRPRKIFVNSMGDLFHESIPDEWIDKVFAVMALCPQHTFQVLTKRAERMRAYVTPARRDAWSRAADPLGDWAPLSPQEYADRAHIFESVPDKRCGIWVSVFSRWPLPNVWCGVSAERQQEAGERIPHLLATPAAVRFVSAEPLLDALDLRNYLEGQEEHGVDFSREVGSKVGCCVGWTPPLDWVIAGYESGPNARPAPPDYVRSLRDQCEAADVPFFFKQWGEHRAEMVPGTDVDMRDLAPNQAVLYTRVGKKAAGRLLDGREHNDFPRERSSA